MTRLNLNDASLLDISGELGPIARNRLHAHLNATPAAKADYNTLAGRYSLLRSLPQPDLSEAEKARIAANLKAAIHAHLDRQTHGKQALRRAKLIHYALASLSAAAAAAVVTAGVILLSPGKPKAPIETAGRVSHVVDRLAAYDSSPGTYEQALDDDQQQDDADIEQQLAGHE